MPQNIESIIQITIALIGAYVAALWFCLVIWTLRDIQKRTRDVVVQILATLLVLLFNVPGLMLYLILRPPETLSEAYARSLGEEALARDIAARQSCAHCHGRIEPDYRVCPSCRTPLTQPCPSCTRLVQIDWSVCPYCATAIAAPTVAAIQSSPATYAPPAAEATAH